MKGIAHFVTGVAIATMIPEVVEGAAGGSLLPVLGTPGSRVRAVGEVTVYRSNLELIPALPIDVTVLAME